MSLIFATQLTALATLALAVLALAAAIVAGIALRKQSSELAILVKENQRQAEERRRAQAAQVYIGIPPAAGNHLIQPFAKNSSKTPVYHGQFWYSGPGGLAGPDDLGVIMPGPVGLNGKQMSAAEARQQTILTFRDADGGRWIRMPDGTLREQALPAVRESVLAILGEIQGIGW